MDNAIIKLKRLKKKIEVMPDNYERMLLITNYYRLYSFLIDAKLIDENDKDYILETDIDKYIIRQYKDTVNYINDLTSNNKRLLEICLELRDVYLRGNWNKKRIKKKIDKKKASELLDDFFRSLGVDIFNLYQSLKDQNISYLSVNISDIDGMCYGMNGEKYSYINVKNYNNDLCECVCIVHEVGHAFHYYLTRNHGKNTIFDINNEVMSLLFEKLFIKFLENTYDNHLSDNSLWYNYHNSHFWILMETMITSSLLEEDQIINIDQTLNCETACNDFEVIEYALNLGYISDTIPNLSLEGYYYIIGNIISDYFLSIMETDFKKGLKAVCDFIQEASYYSIKEILDRYASDLSYTKNNINKVIEKGKSYQKRR